MHRGFLVAGIILLIIGIVMIIAGIIVHENNVSKGIFQPWWVWFLIVGGLVIGIIGGLMMAYSSTVKNMATTVAVASVPMVSHQPCAQSYAQPCQPQQTVSYQQLPMQTVYTAPSPVQMTSTTPTQLPQFTQQFATQTSNNSVLYPPPLSFQ